MKQRIETALGVPHGIARRVVGGWALVWDSTSGVVRAPGLFMQQVERRGMDVEKSVSASLRALRANQADVVRRARAGVTQPLRWLRREALDTSQHAEEEIERQVEHVLERMGIPTRERLDRLGREIDSLTQRIEAELERMAV